jgi:hypothetical protein
VSLKQRPWLFNVSELGYYDISISFYLKQPWFFAVKKKNLVVFSDKKQ